MSNKMDENSLKNQALNAHALFFDPARRKIDWSLRSRGKIQYLAEEVGAVVLENGDVAFTFYAPEAKAVEVAGLEGSSMGGARHAMAPRGDGYWTVRVPGIPAGFHYHEYFVDGVKTTNQLAPYGYGCFLPINYFERPDRDSEFYLLKDVPHGTVRMELYPSKETGRTRNCWIYTPPGYDTDTRKTYPVLYLQHGGGENETGWLWQGKINYIVDNLLAEGKCREMLIVMNCGYAFRGEELSDFLPGDFDAMLVNDCIPFIESRFRVDTNRENRAMAGLSMGSFQTLLTTFTHMDLFAWSGIFSGSLGRREGSTFDPMKTFEDAELFNERMKLLFLGMGEQETGYEPIVKAHAELQSKGIRSVLYTCPGYHEWQVWRKCAYEFLKRIFQQ